MTKSPTTTLSQPRHSQANYRGPEGRIVNHDQYLQLKQNLIDFRRRLADLPRSAPDWERLLVQNEIRDLENSIKDYRSRFTTIKGDRK